MNESNVALNIQRRAAEIYLVQKRSDLAKGLILEDETEDPESPTRLYSLAQAHAERGDFDRVDPLIAQVYRDQPQRKDCYATCAWLCFWLRKDYKRLIHWCEKDRHSGRLSHFWRINLAQAYAADGNIEIAMHLVTQAYQQRTSNLDGYAKCAWHFYWSKKEYGPLIQWMEKDRAVGKLSPAWSLNLAQAYAADGQIQTAWTLVEAAYEKEPDLRDGYAKCAWHYFWPRKDYDAMVLWMNKERTIGRLSPEGIMLMAQAYAGRIDLDPAFSLVEEAYSQDPSLTDGYAKCAWALFWPKWPRREYAELAEIMELDYRTGRMTPPWFLRLAQVYSAADRFDEACRLVETAYKADPALTDGYSKCAWQRFWPLWPRKGFEAMIPWMEKDLELGRMTSPGYLNLSMAYAAVSRYDRALEMVARA